MVFKSNESPLMSHKVFREKVFPQIKDDTCTFFIVIDNLRYDQWKMIESSLTTDLELMKNICILVFYHLQLNFQEMLFFQD